ncbi:hypothetical protein GGR50DRAFT_563425 [Xylaria sp. CBS 124048]|nr:hypothetical protein GGR50DRAFT_563425 [Xylaria sp. CBS 124048]
MPHRVVEFFLAPNDSIHSIKQTVQRHANTSVLTGSKERRHRPVRTPSYGSSDDATVEDHPTTPPGTAHEKHKEHHRLGFPGLSLVGHHHKTPKDTPQTHQSASLDWRIESCPPIMYGSPEDSTGALISGQLQLCVKEDGFEIEDLEAKLEICVTQKKPFNSHCQECCASRKTELKRWSFLSEATTLSQRTHEFPFSALLEGHLPITTNNSLVSIEYVFTAEARPRDSSQPTIKLRRTIDVKRSLSVPDSPHHSVRIFPPTAITASVHYDAIVYPQTTSSFTLRLDGIGKHNDGVHSIEYWKLKRLTWRLEENVSTLAPACKKHRPKPLPGTETAAADDAACKGARRTDSRVIAQADLLSGWKTNYHSAQGSVEAEVEYNTGTASSSSRPASCDMRAPDGTEVTHRLVVEMVVSQEYASLAHTRHVTPTGIARILRMNFGVVVTGRSGLGISWDNEAPPIYQDVPPSPPSYAHTMVQHGSVEDLDLAPDGESSEGPSSPASS